jgi:hypothetical protein
MPPYEHRTPPMPQLEPEFARRSRMSTSAHPCVQSLHQMFPRRRLSWATAPRSASTIKKSPPSRDAEPSVREAVPFGGPQARPSSGLMGHHHSGPSTRHFCRVGPQPVTIESCPTVCNGIVWAPHGFRETAASDTMARRFVTRAATGDESLGDPGVGSKDRSPHTVSPTAR